MTARPVDLSAGQRDAFGRQAGTLPGIDLAAYKACGRDWREPVLGLGPADAPLCIFGRDPGRTEVEHQLPFVGRGGQLVRAGLHQHKQGLNRETSAPSFDDSVAAGADVFWLNTVPYKPVGNKAWPMAVKRRFQPLVAELLLHAWQGRTVIVLGREAFFWFGIDQPARTAAALREFWTRDDRYTATLTIDYQHNGLARSLQLAPLPHPSPANAVWFTRFPALLGARLDQLSPPYFR
ncbi:MAG: uracil-DNA glycosylase family protein [Polaromonas sp.]